MNKNKDNSGALFDNDKKMSENSPDQTGSAKINGVEMWVSAWKNESKSGMAYLSLSFKKKEPKKEKSYRGEETQSSDVPF